MAVGWLTASCRWLALLAPGLIFLAHAQYGAMLPRTALSLVTFSGLLLAAALAGAASLRRDLADVRGVALPAALFAATLLAALWSLTPFAPGGPHPVWDYIGAGPAATTLDKGRTQLEIFKLVGLACIFGLGLLVGAAETRARLAFDAVLALGAALGLFSFFSFVTGATGLKRLGSTFLSWNTAATLFAILLLLALGAAFSRLRAAGRKAPMTDAAPYLGCALVFLACLVATASRAGFTAAALGLVVFALLQIFAGKGKASRKLLIGLGGVVLFAGLLAVSAQQLIDRFSRFSWDKDGRQVIFEAHWRAFQDAPLMGYGLGSFDTVNRTLLDAQNLQELWNVRAAHNVYLTWLEQAGIIGATPMFLCVAALLLATFRNALARSRFTAQLFALLAASAVVLFHGLTDFALETFSMAAFWSFLLGLGFSAAQGWRR